MLFAVLGVTFLVGTRFIYAMARGSHPATVVGGDVTLPCSLEPGHYAKNMTIVWRTSEQDKYVHLSRLNDDGTAGQIPSYKYRTKLFGTDELMKGNISLKLSQVKLSDAGNYTCFLKGIKVTTTFLTVGRFPYSVFSYGVFTWRANCRPKSCKGGAVIRLFADALCRSI